MQCFYNVNDEIDDGETRALPQWYKALYHLSPYSLPFIAHGMSAGTIGMLQPANSHS